MADFIDPKSEWWRQAVCYEVYVRSFADGDGDGVGDLPGITARLPYLRDLGVDALWITPFYPSPQHDHGYDVADYTGVDPLFGDLAAADDLLAGAHELGLRVIVDLVPNHTSSEHAWFAAALAAGPGSPERARYLFRQGRGPEGDLPPNNWQSVFGGPAWTRVEDGEWYLHLFDPTQPDLDWRHPDVGDLFEDVLRFWLDRGVDGFRIDVAHGLYKVEDLRDQVVGQDEQAGSGAVNSTQTMVERDALRDEPMWDQPEVHEVYRRWRKVLDFYDGDRMAVAEAWTQTSDSMARFVRSDELHQSFNFHWLTAPWSAAAFAEVVEQTLSAMALVDASATWVLSNHDVERHPSRYGGGERGLARARAATLAMLALPGSAYLYQGEELGLEQVDVAPEHRQDPSYLRTGEPGRDGCRVPIPWSGDHAPYGFGPGSGQPWIPQPEGWGPQSVAAQTGNQDSTLEFYRRALALRRSVATTAGDEVAVEVVDTDLLVLRRGDLTVVVNTGSTPRALPAGEVLIASAPLPDDPDGDPDAPGTPGTGTPGTAGTAGTRLLPPDTAAWLADPS
ncbi:glycoside hydrolase family 13 protein [Nocardioides donggukensis]|nr:glycoside hydrolase family 13 protein [Nocardioides donggukensis]